MKNDYIEEKMDREEMENEEKMKDVYVSIYMYVGVCFTLPPDIFTFIYSDIETSLQMCFHLYFKADP